MNKVYCQNCKIELKDDDDCVVYGDDEIFCSPDCLFYWINNNIEYDELKVSELF